MSFLTRIFPKKTKTLTEFIALVEKEKISSISITPCMDGSFNAILMHEARSSVGQRIIYRDVITQLTPVAMLLAIRKESIRLCLVGEQRVRALQKKLPRANIHLTFEGKTMKSFEELHEKARAEGVF